MNTYRPTPPSNYLLTALKVLVLILGLYLSMLVLGKVFTWILAMVFLVVKVVGYVIVVFLLLYVFLKVLFGFDLIRFVFRPRR